LITKKKTPFADIPPTMTPTDSDFIAVVNDRLRRLSQAAASAASSAAAAASFSPGSVNANYVTVAMDIARHFSIDLRNGVCQRFVLSAATATGTPLATAATVLAPIFTGGTIGAASSFRLYIDQDATGGWVGPAFTLGSGAFAADVPHQSIDGTPSTRSTYLFTFHGSAWCLDSFRTGGAIA
jgi:hypothetical protein